MAQAAVCRAKDSRVEYIDDSDEDRKTITTKKPLIDEPVREPSIVEKYLAIKSPSQDPKFKFDVLAIINASKDFLIKRYRKYIIDKFFERVYNKIYNLENIAEYKSLVDDILKAKDLISMSILIQYTISPYIFYNSQAEIIHDRDYRL